MISKPPTKFRCLLWLVIPCISYLILACQQPTVQTKTQRTRKFALTKDSTFIGTWYGRVYIEKVNQRDSVNAYFSVYSKDSVIYMYRDYEFGPKGKIREESDREILANSIKWAEHVKFTTRQNARDGVFDFYSNDTILYTYCSPALRSSILSNDEHKAEFVRESYTIAQDNSLVFIIEYQVYSGGTLHYNFKERYRLDYFEHER